MLKEGISKIQSEFKKTIVQEFQKVNPEGQSKGKNSNSKKEEQAALGNKVKVFFRPPAPPFHFSPGSLPPRPPPPPPFLIQTQVFPPPPPYSFRGTPKELAKNTVPPPNF
jgi:hypothetical protein